MNTKIFVPAVLRRLGVTAICSGLLSAGLIFAGGISESCAAPGRQAAPANAGAAAKVKAAAGTKAGKTGAVSAAADGSVKAEGIRAYARMQVLIEYYFMNAGIYPASLEALEHSLNSELPADASRVKIEKEPVSGKPFIYTVSKDRHSYTLSLPNPEVYGRDVPSLRQIDWGWMFWAAEARRIERQTMGCMKSIEALATECEIYAKDHGKAFPAALEDLRPQYMPKLLLCPGCGKPYEYVLRRGGYFISCPDAASHGLSKFGYDSEKGLLIEELDRQKNNAAASGSESTSPANSPESASGRAGNSSTGGTGKNDSSAGD